ncbi:MAG: hypothetical protein QNJ40_02575 [Xanthomonadales bacterium]|nr:hypothetical protein [Xanthomonadales bacterium]
MSSDEEVKQLLIEIRDNQRLALEKQDEHIALAREQLQRANTQVDQSIALQKAAMERFAKLSRVVLPAIILCIVLIVYLVVRYF